MTCRTRERAAPAIAGADGIARAMKLGVKASFALASSQHSDSLIANCQRWVTSGDEGSPAGPGAPAVARDSAWAVRRVGKQGSTNARKRPLASCVQRAGRTGVDRLERGRVGASRDRRERDGGGAASMQAASRSAAEVGKPTRSLPYPRKSCSPKVSRLDGRTPRSPHVSFSVRLQPSRSPSRLSLPTPGTSSQSM